MNDRSLASVVASISSPASASTAPSTRREHLDTPALVVDLDALDANIATIAATAKGRVCTGDRT